MPLNFILVLNDLMQSLTAQLHVLKKQGMDRPQALNTHVQSTKEITH